ncbi:hypothetical protein B0H94_102221 [Salsuginibacillus halophilus]|uniref:AhpC/TSA family protein n=1 Tax=Salsuginibacillus halophilus TaxID=517424 RepID=A0A2P8HXN4_9BACI|nr:hypothetical protein [Salsuginibacillus halophilus]PSL50944.1 hypothetical protein B0H94_102221 [Salsuginibacillus halophilus]
MKLLLRKLPLLFVVTLTGALLAACGDDDEALTALGEEHEDISLENNEQPVVLFHFTGTN